MLEPRWLTAALLCLLVSTGWGCTNDTACGDFPLDDETRRCVVRTVDEMVHETFPFADYKEVDLATFSQSLWSHLEAEADDITFLENVAATVGQLRDGHTRVERRSLEEPGLPPIEVVEEGAALRILHADREHHHLIGRRILAIDGVAVSARAGELPLALAKEDGALTLQGPATLLAGEANTTLTLKLAADSKEGHAAEVVPLTRRRVLQPPTTRRVGKNNSIGLLKLETFGFIDDLERIDTALNELLDTRALIIDLRGNGGGYPSVTDGLFGRLVDHDTPPFELVDRTGYRYRQLSAPPRGQTYHGPVVVLVDGRSYSASNYFAHRVAYFERGVLLGQPTGGGAASPNRGALLLPGVWFQVSTYILQTPSGDHSESGLRPAIPAPSPGLQDVRNGHDPMLEKAIHYLEALR